MFLDFLNVFRKLMDCEPLSVAVISVADKADLDSEIAGATIDNILKNIL